VNGWVLRQTLRQSARTLLILPVGAALFMYLVLLSSSSFLSGKVPAGFFEHQPTAVEAFLGGAANLLEPSGWLAAGMTHPITIALLVAAGVGIAAGAVATELERGAIDLVLGRPVGRVSYLTAKAAAALAALTLVEVGGIAGAVVARATISRIDEIPPGPILLAFCSSWLLFGALAMVALLTSAQTSLRGRALGLSVGVVVGSFTLNFLALLVDGLSGLRYLSVFHYFRAGEILEGHAGGWNLAVLAAVGIAAAVVATWRFTRRDLTH